MTRQTIGFLAGVLGSAAGAWWWMRRRGQAQRGRMTARRDQGTVIFRNTPTAPEESTV